MVQKLAFMWRNGNDEERQAMARSLFTQITYDLDTRRMTDFKLKPWADRFLTVRGALYGIENKHNDDDSGDGGQTMPEDTHIKEDDDHAADVKGLCTDTAQTPVWGTSVHSLETATQTVLRLLYSGQPTPQNPQSNKTPRKVKRNDEIRERYAQGETIPELAKAFGLSNARVHQILHGKRK
ncbi:MAG: helix-turn-helix domain-containing protein [Anaerolineales bacterium]